MLTIGGVDTDLFTGKCHRSLASPCSTRSLTKYDRLLAGNITWIPLSSSTPTFWSIPLQDILVASTSLNISNPSIAIDSGTSLIGVPSTVARAVYAAIPGSRSITFQGSDGYYSFPCKAQVKFALKIGGVQWDVESTDFNSGNLDSAGTVSNQSGCCDVLFAVANADRYGAELPRVCVRARHVDNLAQLHHRHVSRLASLSALSDNCL